MKYLNNFRKNRKGSSILTVVIAILVLSLLGIAVATISISTLNQSVADSSNNEAYYASESGIKSAVDHLKHEVVSYYRQMSEAEGSEYSVLYSNFFQSINLNSQTDFVEPSIDGVQTDTMFLMGSFNSADNTCEFIIRCISTTADNASYRVDANVLVKRIDIKATDGGELVLVDDAALIAGNLFEIPKNCGATINGGGDVIVKECIIPESWMLKINGGGELLINPNIGESVVDILNYNSYSNPDMSNPNAVADGNTTYNWGSIPPSPIKIISTPGSDIHVNSCTITGGVIHSQGDLHMNNGTFTVDLYADGDVHINNCTINGDIYCRGIFYGNNAVINGSVVSETSVDWHNGALNGAVYGENSVTIHDASGIGDVISPGPIDITKTGINGGLVYSSTKITVGDCSIKALLYCMQSIEISKSMTIEGAIIAKEDVNFDKSNTWFTINYSSQIIEEIMGNTDYSFFQPESGQSQTLDAGVFVSEQITTVGRIN